MKKNLALLIVILIFSFVSLVGSEENASINFSLYQNSSGEVEPLFLHNCQSDYCNSNNYESNEGPGSPDCCPRSGAGGYEECFDDPALFKKSTAHAFCIGFPEKIGTDYCDSSNSNILHEAYINCELLTCDDIQWVTKDCRDFNYCTSWEYYCSSTEVKRKRQCVVYGCSTGACVVAKTEWQYETLSSKGADDYCSERKSRGCSLCGHGDYDCDYDSECSSSLYCMGPIGGALDGCCYSYEWWDENNYRCCECSSGVCCDGCHYRTSSYVCDSHVSGSDQYKCDSNCLDYDVLKRYQKQYCSGSSSSCTGSKEWVQYNYENCIFPEYCSGSTIWGTTIPTCKNAQCTSGVCCDTTCGVYNFRPTSYVCIDDLPWYGCPWGIDLGSDVGKKIGDRYCDGYTDACNGKFVLGPWAVKEDCDSKQYCEGEESPKELWCKNIACSSDPDCPSDYWYGLECEPVKQDIYGTFVDYKCINPGTKESACTSTETYKKKEDCGENGYVGDPYCWNYNMQPSVFQDYATRWCQDNSCKENIERQLIKICQTGCTNGVCNEDACTDECSSGQTRCNGNVKQACGNYDADSCLEWPSSTNGTGNENCGKSKYCSSNTCNSCSAGTANCNENPLDACEINILTDNNNCGSCGNVCGSGKSCVNGNCTTTCPSGWLACPIPRPQICTALYDPVCADNKKVYSNFCEACREGSIVNCYKNGLCQEGDVNWDNKVDIFDLAAVGLSYGSKSGDNNWNQKADLNMNGQVDIFDLATVGLNYGRSC